MTPKQGTLTIITARGESKGVPGKNTRTIGGKPLIAWTIEAALHSAEGMRIIVSTDDENIARVSRECGAEVPFTRPTDLASDTATSESVVSHALNWLELNENYRPDLILLLQPTSPFRSAHDIDNALRIQKENNADAIVSVTKNNRPVQWLRRIDQFGILTAPHIAESISRRQEAEQLYQLNGAIYLIKTKVFVRERTFCPKNTRAYIMPVESSIDIDCELDLLIADLVMQHRQKEKKKEQK